MKTRVKKVVCMLLAGLTVLGAAGCGGTTAKLEDLYIPTYEDNGQHHRTMASLPPNLANKEQAEIYKAAGFNAAPYTEDFVSAADVPTKGAA